jgi:hypothetical protein
MVMVDVQAKWSCKSGASWWVSTVHEDEPLLMNRSAKKLLEAG